jgi:uncharacterized protein
MEFRSEQFAENTLIDRWSPREPIPLDGFLERQGYSPLTTMVFGLIAALILFQAVFSPLFIVIFLALSGVPLSDMLGPLGELVREHTRSLLLANTAGQVLGLAMLALLLARWHSTRPAAYLRMRYPDGHMLGASIVGLFGLMPVVQWLGAVNDRMPMPDFVREMDTAAVELIQQLLLSDLGFTFSLITLAVTPAICEELLFRGYVQRQAERRMGVMAAILFSGIIFGMYHLRFTQLIPLSVLGIYIAYVFWQTGSLWTAVVVHFANNAALIAVASAISGEDEAGVVVEGLEGFSVPWYAVVLGLIVTGASIVYLRVRAANLLKEKDSTAGGVPFR